MRLILASESPRRAELLQAAGFAFQIRAAGVDESARPGENPREHVVRLAREKAEAIDVDDPEAVVLGSDTVVVVGRRMLGKPRNGQEAAEMLRLLSGKSHKVLTGVALRRGDERLVAVESTRVRFLPLDEQEIAWYLATREPLDKAGAYAIQGGASRFIDHIEGSYTNVVGLPVATVYRLLLRLGWPRVDPVRSGGYAG